MSTDTLSIYETPVSSITFLNKISSKFTSGVALISCLFQSMGLLDKKSLKITGIK